MLLNFDNTSVPFKLWYGQSVNIMREVENWSGERSLCDRSLTEFSNSLTISVWRNSLFYNGLCGFISPPLRLWDYDQTQNVSSSRSSGPMMFKIFLVVVLIVFDDIWKFHSIWRHFFVTDWLTDQLLRHFLLYSISRCYGGP